MSIGTKLLIAELHRLAALGMTYGDAAENLGCSYANIVQHALRHGVAFRLKQRGRKALETDLRSEDMRALYTQGQTLEQIGQKYSITRERVRQIMKKRHGVTAKDGGAAERGRQNKAKRNKVRDQKSLKAWGCTHREYMRILRHKGRPTYAYWSQRKNANTRGIAWEFNLWQWWKIWELSGHWDARGRGHGYAMCRHNDVGPYSPDNVYIATCVENIQDYWANKRAEVAA